MEKERPSPETSVVEEKREMVLASLEGDGEEMSLTGILDFAGVFPGGGCWPAPVCIVRTPSSVMLLISRIIDLGGGLNFIGEPNGKRVASIWFCASAGSLMDPEAVLFAGTGRLPFVTLAADTG
jgi:hypothetical protein